MREQKIIMVNDTEAINNIYREKLLKILRSKFKNVSSMGLFGDRFISKVKFMLLAIFSNIFVISSNLRSNVFSLGFFWTRGVVILNGMGRFRKSKTLRILLIALFNINYRKSFLIQSYADYRYFNRYSNKNFYWVPGSGGVCKKIGSCQSLLSVQRNDKLNLTGASLLEFSNYIEQKVNIVGCTNESTKNFSNFNFIGRVESKNIFLSGGVFLQPKGYGEGFPHTLADAIVSKMKIYISSSEYVRYGLHKLGGRRDVIFKGWFLLKNTNLVAQEVNEEKIVNVYLELISKNI